MKTFENVRLTHCTFELYAPLAEEEQEGTLIVDEEHGNVTFKYEDTQLALEDAESISFEETNVSVICDSGEFYFELSSPDYEEEVITAYVSD